MIAGIVGVTLLVVAVAAPKPKMVYEATALVTPTAQVMQGGLTTTANKDSASNAAPDRSVILSNLIILAQQPDVYDAARSFLEKSGEEQRQEMADMLARKSGDTDLPKCATLVRIETEPGHALTPQDWPEVLEVAPCATKALVRRARPQTLSV